MLAALLLYACVEPAPAPTSAAPDVAPDVALPAPIVDRRHTVGRAPIGDEDHKHDQGDPTHPHHFV